MGERKGLWTKEKAGSEISASDKRLRRYVSIYAKRRAYEKTKQMFLKGSRNYLKDGEAIVTVAEASRRAMEMANGAGKRGGQHGRGTLGHIQMDIHQS